MDIEFDKSKDESNIAKHGISLKRAVDIEILHQVQDDRSDYGENRYRVWGLIDGMYHSMAYTIRNGRVRIISLRRAHEKEIRRYVSRQRHGEP